MNVSRGVRAERLMAKRYEESGYAVQMDPPPAAIPFSLGSYRPDILATKGNEHLLIEVKRSGAKVDERALMKIDQEVQQHPGWRFLLVTVAEEELEEPSSVVLVSTDVTAIRGYLQKIDRLIGIPDAAGLVLPQLWLTYISALRLALTRDGVPLDGATDLSVINRAYSEGLVSIEEYEAGRRLLKLRNEAAHNFQSDVTLANTHELRSMIDAHLARLELPSS